MQSVPRVYYLADVLETPHKDDGRHQELQMLHDKGATHADLRRRLHSVNGWWQEPRQRAHQRTRAEMVKQTH